MNDQAMIECPRCEGCGQIANDEDGTPWRAWLELPLKIRQRFNSEGIVRPLLCPVCKGKGKIPAREKE